VAVAGTYFVQAEALPWEAFYAGVPLGCAITAILVVNNLRDIETDRRAGKVTLGVVMGDAWTRRWYLFLIVAGVAVAVASWPAGVCGPWALLSLASLAVALPPARAVATGVSGRALNPWLKATARFALVLGVCFGAGLAL
jgi:1,4-dihydroxy-2-naphthoate octaprenyltransferase